MSLDDGHAVTQLLHAVQIGLVAAACGWLVDRVIGSERRGWIIPIASGISGLYLGPRIAVILGWQWGPAVGGQLVLPLLAGASVACVFMKLLTLGFDTQRR